MVVHRKRPPLGQLATGAASTLALSARRRSGRSRRPQNLNLPSSFGSGLTLARLMASSPPLLCLTYEPWTGCERSAQSDLL